LPATDAIVEVKTILQNHLMSRRHLNPVPSAVIVEVRALLGAEKLRRDLLIEYLHRTQDSYGFISVNHLAAVGAEATRGRPRPSSFSE
jgi:hypothetical protein